MALVLEHFSEETREAIVEDSLIAPRLAQGIAQRRQSSQDLDAALADILADERQRVGRLCGSGVQTRGGFFDDRQVSVPG